MAQQLRNYVYSAEVYEKVAEVIGMDCGNLDNNRVVITLEAGEPVRVEITALIKKDSDDG
ncbi:hypothetical protein JCM19235_1971 [Vibrio maritimus]|uniref:Uncharacterized protein n=1 Tax=Vibrio maritimus TaxID=990268 RepID=A0A090RVH8_9VIBR|nr:hypothetical protein JCM19235_1971 [Vibrio maritimus]